MSGRVRCAIYTRKSTDEGLEQEFNSLHAQREACEAYIRSQRGMGWVALPTAYDDGGLSGGTLDRPALQALLADIELRKIDSVVVYKVDRLTRSLSDFAKIVEVFDAEGVSFVSVTQQFNTTTSMGRLTLNMLLSFSQFEREVTAERIRDKVAASKRKGMWMGGPVPLGYDSQDKKLVVNEAEATVVRQLFDLYLKLRSVDAVKLEADRLGIVTKRHVRGDRTVGGLPFSRGNLYQLLHNPIYVGEIPHKSESYPGQHDGIIAREVWDAVQESLSTNTRERRSPINTKSGSFLAEKLYDETGDRLVPTAAQKGSKRYRYYTSQRLVRKSEGTRDGWRVPAQQLERAVAKGVAEWLADPVQVSEALGSLSAGQMEAALARAGNLASELDAGAAHKSEILAAIVDRVALSKNRLEIEVCMNVLLERLMGSAVPTNGQNDEFIAFDVPIEFERRGVEARLVMRSDPSGSPDKSLISLVARSYRWLDQLTSGEVNSVRQIARAEGIDEGDVSRFLPLAFLAPETVHAIACGEQRSDVTVEQLRKSSPLSYCWKDQSQLLTDQPPG